jgi:hypothetical protein
MDGRESRRADAKVDNACARLLHEDNLAEITVSCDKHAVLFARRTEQIEIVCFRKPCLKRGQDIVPEVGQKAGCQGVDVLVEKELHSCTDVM